MPVGGRINKKIQLRSKNSAITSQNDDENKEIEEDKPEKIPGLKSLALLKEKNATRKSMAMNKVTKEVLPVSIDQTSNIRNEDKEINVVYNLESNLKTRINSRRSRMVSKDINPKCVVETEITKDIEIIEDVSKAKSFLKRKKDSNDNLILNTTKDTPSKKLKSDISNVIIDVEMPQKESDDILVNLSENKIPKVKGTPTKGRMAKKNNIQQVMKIVQEDIAEEEIVPKKIVVEKIVPEKIVPENIIPEKIESPILHKEMKVMKSRGRKPKVLVTDKDDCKLTKNEPNKDVVMEIDDIKMFSYKVSSKVENGDQKVNNLHKEETETNCAKIPGLALLQNLKNRKSGLLNKTDYIGNLSDCSVIIPGLESIADIKRRKTQLLTQTSEDSKVYVAVDNVAVDNVAVDNVAVDNVAVDNVAVSEDIVIKPLKKNTSGIKKGKSVTLQACPVVMVEKMGDSVATPSTVETSREKSVAPPLLIEDTSVKTSLKASKIIAHKPANEIIPGLASTAEIRRRKSVMKEDSPLMKEEKPLLNAQKSTNENIPGLASTAEIRRRKSVMNETTSLMKEETTVTSLVNSQKPANDIIPGLASTAEIRLRKSAINTVEPTTSHTKIEPEKTAPSVFLSKKPPVPKKVQPESPKIPGFTVIEEMRNRKSALLTQSKTEIAANVQSPVASKIPLFKGDVSVASVTPTESPFSGDKTSLFRATNPMTNEKPSHFLDHKPKIQETLPQSGYSSINRGTSFFAGSVSAAPKSSLFHSNTFSAPRTPLTSVAPQNLFSSPQVTSRPSSILRTPVSAFKTNDIPLTDITRNTTKRPISCLDNDMSMREPQGKIAKTEQESNVFNRRRSVTFSNRVQLKEIKGNSFNSESDDHDQSQVVNDQEKRRQEIEKTLEKTKSFLAQKRLTAVNNPFSMTTANSGQYGTGNSRNNADAIAKKSSTLLDDKFNKRKAQYKAAIAAGTVPPPPAALVEPYNFSSGYYGSLTQESSIPARTNIESRAVDFSNEISDDEMEVDESKPVQNVPASNCCIM